MCVGDRGQSMLLIGIAINLIGPFAGVGRGSVPSSGLVVIKIQQFKSVNGYYFNK